MNSMDSSIPDTLAPPFEQKGDDLLVLLEQYDEVVLFLDEAFRFQYVNRLGTQLLGQPTDALIGCTTWEIFPDMVGTLVETRLREAMQERTVASFEVDDLVPDKRFQIRSIPLGESNVALFLRDITEERRAHANLEEAFRFRERLVETIADVLYLHDLPERKTTYLNRQLETMLGYDKMRLTALNFEERRALLYHPDDFAVLKSAAERYRGLRDNETMETEYRVRSAEGEWRWLCSRESVFSRNENGLPTRILGIARDVTDQHRILEISETSRARYRTLVTLLSDWIFETDTDGKYVYVSPQVTNVLGYDPAEMIERSPLDFMPAEEAAREGPVLRHIAATQASFAMRESIYRTKSGELIHHESSGMPIYDHGGNWIGHRGVERNITDRKRYETMLATIAEKQGRIAETLQSSLLLTPDRTAFPDVEVVTRYEPASDEALVGGDFFDVFRLDDDRTAFVVGDVTGKGLEAATDTAEIKFLLRAYLREMPLKTVFSRLNRQIMIRRQLDNRAPNVFVCLSVAVLDTRDGTLEFAVAGMEPPILIRPATPQRVAEVVEISQGGLPLGTMLNGVDDEAMHTYRLARGDLFLLYSDGITEARSASLPDSAPPEQRFFGNERLLQALNGTTARSAGSDAPLPASQIADTVLEAVYQFAGKEQRDDICLLVGRYTAEVSEPTSFTTDTAPILISEAEDTPGDLIAQLTTALRERDLARQEVAAVREHQRQMICGVLANVTGGRLLLCHQASDLPPHLASLHAPMALVSSESLFPLRRLVETAAETIGMPRERVQELLMAVGEAAMNCIVHAGGGWASLSGDATTGQLYVQISDSGRGIAEAILHRATLEPGYTTAGSLGFGFSMMHSAADYVYLMTGPSGTTIILEQNIISPHTTYPGI